jgi:hypothetical protein
LSRRNGFLVPLQKPVPLTPESATWRKGEGCRVLPVKTHLLGVLDRPIEVLERYCGSLLQPNDVLTIGETPLAVMQGRYAHPSTVQPSMLARLLCRVCGLFGRHTPSPPRPLCTRAPPGYTRLG